MTMIISGKEIDDYIGRPLVSATWHPVNQHMIDAFAELTGDRQFIHVDPQRARSTPFGSTIAHGYLTLSLLPAMLEDIQLQPADAGWGLNYGLDRLRFLNPVPAGAALRATSTLLAAEARSPGTLLLRSAVSVEIRDVGKPALAAQTLAMWVMAP